MVAACFLLASQTLTVRTAAIDITPEEPLPLGGYTERKGANFSPSESRLTARAVEIGDVVIVSVETLTVPRSFYESVQKELGNRKLFLVATHTHCAPDSQMLNERMTFAVPGIASYRPSVATWTRNKIVELVRNADKSPSKVTSDICLAKAKVNLNRARRKDGKPDPTAWSVSGNGQTLFQSYAAHATFHEADWLKLDGDWPGSLAAKNNVPVLPGAIGDVSPVSQGNGPVEKCHFFVENFSKAIARAKLKRVWTEKQKTGFSIARIALDQPVPHPTFSKAYGVPEALSQVVVGKFAEPTAEVTVARWGSFVLVGIPGEPTAAVGREIVALARKIGFPHCLVVSHTNGWIGYILQPQDYARGGYEATLSFNGPNTSVRVVDAARRALQSVFNGQ